MSFKHSHNHPLIIPLMGAPGAQLSGTSLKENLTDPQVQAKSLIMLYERFKPDGIFTFMDLTVEAEMLGSELKFPENLYPSIKEQLIKDIKDLTFLEERVSDYFGGRMDVFTETVRLLSQKLSPMIGAYTISPFTLAGELMGVEELCESVLLEPEFVNRFLKFTTDVIIVYAKALIDAGADTIMILDPAASLLSPRAFKRLREYYDRLCDELKKPLILHICGDTNHLIPSMGELHFRGLSLDARVNLKDASEKVPDNIYLIGNIDPVKVFLEGHPDRVRKETDKLLKSMKGVSNFILSSACDIPLETSIENIKVFMEIGRNYTKDYLLKAKPFLRKGRNS